jgi:hypothetical protein
MKAFDTDILTEILVGNPAYADRYRLAYRACSLACHHGKIMLR